MKHYEELRAEVSKKSWEIRAKYQDNDKKVHIYIRPDIFEGIRADIPLGYSTDYEMIEHSTVAGNPFFIVNGVNWREHPPWVIVDPS